MAAIVNKGLAIYGSESDLGEVASGMPQGSDF